MVVVEFQMKEIEGESGFARKKIIDGLTEMGAPCEENEGNLVVELTPNRPDWFSMNGLIRALRTYYGGEIKGYHINKSKYVVEVDGSVSMRPYTVCAIVKDLKFTDQRIKDMVMLQEKLNLTLGRKVKKFGMGIYPLENIEFPVKYTTMKPEEINYQPLTYEKPANAVEILTNHPKGMEYGYLLKDCKRYPVFVDAKKRIMCLIPIVNSAETGQVTEETREVFIEVTGIEINSIMAALNIIVCNFVDMGGKAYEVKVKYPDKKITTPDLTPNKIKINLGRISKILGIEIKENDAKKMLARMGYEYNKGIVMIPPYRADVIHEVDVMEDLAIVYGYNNFKPTLPGFFNEGETNKTWDDVDSTLRGMGYSEIDSFVLTNKDKLKMIGYELGAKEIENPKTEEFTVIRPTLFISMLEAFSYNKMKGLPQKFYEIGVIYENDESKKKVAFGCSDRNIEFSEFRGILQSLMKELKFDFELKSEECVLFGQEICAGVYVKGKRIGLIGKVNKRIMNEFGLEFPIYLCELELM